VAATHTSKARRNARAHPPAPSVFDHLSSTLLRIITERPADANAQLENISMAVREASFVPPKPDSSGPGSGADNDGALAWATATGALFRAAEGDAEPGEVPDMLDEAGLYEWAGAGMGKEAVYAMLSRSSAMPARYLEMTERDRPAARTQHTHTYRHSTMGRTSVPIHAEAGGGEVADRDPLLGQDIGNFLGLLRRDGRLQRRGRPTGRGGGKVRHKQKCVLRLLVSWRICPLWGLLSPYSLPRPPF